MHPSRQGSPINRMAGTLLKSSGVIWFLTAAVGQLGFVYYILIYYGGRTARGDYSAWNDRPIIKGYVDGDGPGNLMFALHVLLAMIVTFGGLLQLIPPLRQRIPAFHRWNGRIFMLISIFMALGGIWMVWGRGSYMSVASGIPTTINGILILVFIAVAYRLAVKRRIDDHRQWAMRTFMAVNGVWFFRVMIMLWLILNQGPRWNNGTLSGPADLALAYGSYLIPLVGLELYFAAGRSSKAWPKFAVAGLVFALTLLMAVGIFGTITMMWWPAL